MSDGGCGRECVAIAAVWKVVKYCLLFMFASRKMRRCKGRLRSERVRM